MKRRALFEGKLDHLRLADRANAEFVDRLVEALRKQRVDHFLANLGREPAAHDVLRHLSGTEAGNLGVLAIFAGNVAPGLGHLVGGNIDDEFTSAVGIKNRAVCVFVGFFGG